MLIRNLFKKFFDSADQEEAKSKHLVTIETPRLVLREFRDDDDDADAVYKITQKNNFEFHYFDGTMDSVKSFIQKSIENQEPNPKTGQRDNIMLAVETKDDGKLVGFVSLETVTYHDGTVVIEPNFFIDPDIQNKGYGREAAINIMKHAFDDCNITRLNATIEAGNKPSLAVAYSEGYQYTGKDIEFDTNHGRRKYMIMFLDKETFYEKRANDKKSFILPPPSNDNPHKPSL